MKKSESSIMDKKIIKKVLALGIVIVIIGAVIYTLQSSVPEDDEDIGTGIEDDPDKVTVYWFWDEDCPICEKQRQYIDELEEDDDIEVKKFDIYGNTEDRKVFQKLVEIYDVPIASVPTTFIGDEYWVSFDEGSKQEMEDAIESCMESDQCSSPGEKLSNN